MMCCFYLQPLPGLQILKSLRAIVEPFTLGSRDKDAADLIFSPIGLESEAVQNYIHRVCSALERTGVVREDQVESARRKLEQDPLLAEACQVGVLQTDH